MTRFLLRLRPWARERSNGNGALLRPIADSADRARYVVTAAESAPCTCPDFCERDHETD
ncbi:MAG TPA: hypothetical protein VEG40_01140 [Gaiellaceae bacterium]|nr:hypothetical protein [Gaiellaceae bacterium]